MLLMVQAWGGNPATLLCQQKHTTGQQRAANLGAEPWTCPLGPPFLASLAGPLTKGLNINGSKYWLSCG